VSLYSAFRTEAQTVSLDRPYEPVILKGKSFPAYSYNVAKVDQHFLFKYNSFEDTWEQIPLQIDEVEPVPGDTTGKTSYFVPGDGLLDDQDELVFMAVDAGDKAPANKWLNDASSLGFMRYEIELVDPLAAASKGYVYLYRSTTWQNSPALKDYVRYIAAPPNTGKDIILGQSYHEGHLPNGISDTLWVPVSAGGSGVDFLDRLKLRVQIKLGFFTFNITENDFNYVNVKFRDGRVRIIRELTERINTINIEVPLLIKYYGYSAIFSTALDLSSISGVSLLRQSFDFQSNVTGAKWYNQNIFKPVIVDGSPDNLPNDSLAVVTAPNLNWCMLSGAPGSYVNIFSIPAGLGSSQRFYYRDAPSGTNDGTNDTGDNMSFGDSGLWISGTNITGVFPLVLTSFILGKDQPRSVGETLRNQVARPLGYHLQAQTYTLPVELVSFTVTADRDRAQLQWTTASESNNFGFYIERGAPSPGVNRQQRTSWQDVGFVAGHGNSSTPQAYSFVDASLSPGKYYYRLRQVDRDGSFAYSPEREVSLLLPSQLALTPAYPNPLGTKALLGGGSPEIVIRYQLPNPEPVAVSLRLFNVLGQQVRQLVNAMQPGGFYEARWDGRLENGARAPAGIYFYQLRAGDQMVTKKLMLL
jgi:hypothetical protein